MKTRILSICIALLITMQLFAINDFSVGGISYTLLGGDSVEVGQNPNATGTIDIPSTVTKSGVTYRVTRLGDRAFYGCSNLWRISIPEGVTAISNYAFYQCSSLEMISIPSSVKFIGAIAFDYCTSLVDVNITDLSAWCSINFSTGSISNPLYYADLYLNGDKVIDLAIPNDVTSISKRAFFHAKFNSVTIGSNVMYIEDEAFAWCTQLSAVSFSNSVISIGENAFANCQNLTSVTIPNSVNYAYGNSFRTTGINTPIFNDHLFIMLPTAYTGTYSIPNGITTVAKGACENCSELTNVTFPSTLRFIREGAFSGCSNITSIIMPSNVDSIGALSFANCISVDSISLPNRNVIIGKRAFKGCLNIESIRIPENVSTIGFEAFFGCSKLKTVYWDAKECEAPLLFGSSITSFIFGEAVEFVPNTICYSMSNLASVVFLGNNVNIIGDSAFYNCDGLSSFTIPQSVVSIGEAAFYGCSNISSIEIPQLVAAVGDKAFYNCSRLDSIVWNAKNCGDFSQYNRPFYGTSHKYFLFEDEVEYIPAYICYSMQGLKSIYIGKKVNCIGENAFYNCSKLKSVTLNSEQLVNKDYSEEGTIPFKDIFGEQVIEYNVGDDVSRIGKEAFANHLQMESITIGKNVRSIGRNAFYYCRKLERLNMPSSIQEIEVDAFTTGNVSDTLYIDDLSAWCKIKFRNIRSNPMVNIDRVYVKGELLTNLTIPEDVTHVEDYAFVYYWRLKSINIPSNVQSIGKGVFMHSGSNVDTIYIPESVVSVGDSAFYHTWVKHFYIGENVTSIGTAAFGNNMGMETVTILNGALNVEENAFDGYTWKFTDMYVPCGTLCRFLQMLPNYSNKLKYTASPYSLLLYADETQGVISLSSEFNSCEAATIEAIPNESYVFDHWSDDNTENPREIIVDADIELTAYFSPVGGTDIEDAYINDIIPHKVLQDGQIFILRGDKTYTLPGAEVK